ncbi:hypothetical protein HID58_025869 [Brassica napus]|uniref:FAF domain-containing protein n=1 Tax=Brassica napus TaxID=3708 RepID=A0ABQ8CMC3_BRANA|nr:hypothetical protein HID58_025869 [Brassica napus]
MERASSSSSKSSSSMASCSSDQSLSIISDKTSSYLTSSMISRTSSSSSSAVGDYIGTESCFDVLSADEENDEREARAAAAREFPPPIPLLAQTENLLPHMPWVLKRVLTSDGRLILREEKVRHHEYFRAHRSNGHGVIHNCDHDKGNVHGGSEDGYRKAILAAVADETVVESGGGGSPRGKCLKSCFVGMIVREIRPVLS